MELKFILGDPSSAAIYTAEEGKILCQSSIFPTTGWHLCSEVVNAEAVSNYILQKLSFKPETLPLIACAAAAGIHKLMPDATISTRVLSQPLSEAQWVVQGRF
jgi:hypothetical protein